MRLAIISAFFLLMIACAPLGTPTVRPTPTPTWPSTFKDGAFVIGQDLDVGYYRTDGGTSCVYEAYQMDLDLDRADAAWADGAWRVVFHHAPPDYVVWFPYAGMHFVSFYCGTWRRIPSPSSRALTPPPFNCVTTTEPMLRPMRNGTPQPLTVQSSGAPECPTPTPIPRPTSFSDGKFSIGRDIRPGTYQTTGTTDAIECEIEYISLNGITKEPELWSEVFPYDLGRHTGRTPTPMRIVRRLTTDNDYIRSQGCGTWTRIAD